MAYPNPLTEFQIFPRATLQACVDILFHVDVRVKKCATRSATGPEDVGSQAEIAHDLLIDRKRTWPLTVQVASPLGIYLSGLIVNCKNWLKFITTVIPYDVPFGVRPYVQFLQRYLIALPTFHDSTAEVDGQGVVVGDEASILREEFQRSQTVYHTGHFEDTVLAAHWVKQVYDKRMAAQSAEIDEAGEAMANHTNLVIETDGLSIHDSEADSTIFTLSETRASSPTPTERPSTPNNAETGINIIRTENNNIGHAGDIKLTYVAVLETRDDTMTFDINPTCVEYPESELLGITKTVWTWASNSGINRRGMLSDVVTLAEKLASRLSGEVSSTTAVDLAQLTWEWMSDCHINNKVQPKDAFGLVRTLIAKKEQVEDVRG